MGITPQVRKVDVVNTKNRLLTAAVGSLLDGPAILRSYLIRNVITEGFVFESLMRDDEALDAFVRKATIGVWHASCSCRMGADGDPMAVTDNQGRVRGVEVCAWSMPRFPARTVRQHQLSDVDDSGKDHRHHCAQQRLVRPKM